VIASSYNMWLVGRAEPMSLLIPAVPEVIWRWCLEHHAGRILCGNLESINQLIFVQVPHRALEKPASPGSIVTTADPLTLSFAIISPNSPEKPLSLSQ